MTSPSSTTTITEFSGGFDTDRIDALTERGILEEKLMNGNAGGLLEEIVKKSNNKKKKKKKNDDAAKQKRPSTAMFARTLSQDGVVRLNGSLSAATAAALREDILNRRDDAFAAVISPMGKEQGSTNKEDWRNYFADVLLKRNRCDLLLPLKNNPHLQTALHEILVTSNVLSSVLQTATGGNDNDATLYELSALISEPGSPRQPIHPDNPHQEHPPLLTAFIALQNITPPMGPTIFLPRTNTADAHERYNNVPDRDEFLESSPSVMALLNTGDISLFDSRTMHCGGANDVEGGSTRVLLYMSFRNPRAVEPIGNVGSMMSDIKRMTVRELRTKLAEAVKNGDDGDDPF